MLPHIQMYTHKHIQVLPQAFVLSTHQVVRACLLNVETWTTLESIFNHPPFSFMCNSIYSSAFVAVITDASRSSLVHLGDEPELILTNDGVYDINS